MTKINKTKDYEIFNFREDNRASIDATHLKRLKESIQSRNLLELRPILVNSDMEVLDGQHRLMAAKSLGLDIYYQVEQNTKSEDIILMNINKSWTSGDFLNYYCKNGFKEYQKLDDFIKSNNISLRVGLIITMGESSLTYHEYKIGNYVFAEEITKQDVEMCWDTIKYINKMNGHSSYTQSARFWKALIKLTQHSEFDENKWKQNLTRMVERCGPRARIEDYYRMLMEIYNWRNNVKIDLLHE